MRLFKVVVVVLLVALMGACSKTDAPASKVLKLGLVTVDEVFDASVSDDTFVEAYGAFLAFEQPLSDFDPSKPYDDLLDTCTVSDESDTDPSPIIEDEAFEFIRAGESLTVTGARPYAVLDKHELSLGERPLIVYMADPGRVLATPVPAGLTVSIPGDAFPAFKDVTLRSVTPFRLASPAQLDAINKNTTFTWNSKSNNSVIMIDVIASDTSGTNMTFVSCTAKDDGTFSFPPETKALLADTFSGHLSTASRQAYQIETRGDAVLLLSASSTHMFDNNAF